MAQSINIETQLRLAALPLMVVAEPPAGAAPYEVDVQTSLALDSDSVGRTMTSGQTLRFLERAKLDSGEHRARVVLEGEYEPIGWVTISQRVALSTRLDTGEPLPGPIIHKYARPIYEILSPTLAHKRSDTACVQSARELVAGTRLHVVNVKRINGTQRVEVRRLGDMAVYGWLHGESSLMPSAMRAVPTNTDDAATAPPAPRRRTQPATMPSESPPSASRRLVPPMHDSTPRLDYLRRRDNAYYRTHWSTNLAAPRKMLADLDGAAAGLAKGSQDASHATPRRALSARSTRRSTTSSPVSAGVGASKRGRARSSSFGTNGGRSRSAFRDDVTAGMAAGGDTAPKPGTGPKDSASGGSSSNSQQPAKAQVQFQLTPSAELKPLAEDYSEKARADEGLRQPHRFCNAL